jgi:DNA-binding NarL/FixJ family response regulator
MKKLLIVDDHRLFADSIRFLLEHTTDYEVVGVLHTGAEVLPFMARHRVHLVLLDIDLPDVMGFELARTIQQTDPEIKILALSMLNDNRSIERMIDAGAAGYCVKSVSRDELFAAIQAVGDGRHSLPVEYFTQTRDSKNSTGHPVLTGRETEIIQFIANGISTRQIAEKLYLSERTVETHRKNIYRKLGVHTNVELTLYARNNRMIG